jgi:transposase
LCGRINIAPERLKKEQAIGRSKGGLITKVHATVNALSNSIRLYLTSGQGHNPGGADKLFGKVHAQAVIAGKAYDVDEQAIGKLGKRGFRAIIPSECCVKQRRALDRHMYKARHVIENFFAGLNNFEVSSPGMIKLPENSWPVSTLPIPISGRFDDTPWPRSIHC